MLATTSDGSPTEGLPPDVISILTMLGAVLVIAIVLHLVLGFVLGRISGLTTGRMRWGGIVAAALRLPVGLAIWLLDLSKLPSDDQLLRWPAPTVLVDGTDLFGLAPLANPAMACRVYPAGVPTVEAIQTALEGR